jgi:hypothetical protein
MFCGAAAFTAATPVSAAAGSGAASGNRRLLLSVGILTAGSFDMASDRDGCAALETWPASPVGAFQFSPPLVAI